MAASRPSRSLFFAPARLSLARAFSNSSSPINSDVEERIMALSRRFLEKVKDAKIDKLTPAASFTDLGMDSLDAVDFIVALEEEFKFDIANEDAENRIKSIKDACVVFSEYVEKKKTDQGANKV
jgi:NADH dehydrogenase (ubiquinone) 1 alpha/beta subcomplex 1